MDLSSLAAAGLRSDIHGPIATITLDRPGSLNAQTPSTWRALGRWGSALPDSVRVVVVRGAGQSFSSGLDRAMLDPEGGQGEETVAGLLALSDREMEDRIGEYQQGFTFLRDPRFVSIAAVQGHAIGAGFQLALACDLRIASADAEFAMMESSLGLVPDLTGTQPLVAAVGYARALEMCATGRTVDAAEALRIGLVLDVVSPDGLDGRVAELVEALCDPLPGVVPATKLLLQQASQSTLTEQSLLERHQQVRRMRALARLAQR